jgi:hypothetical protein
MLPVFEILVFATVLPTKKKEINKNKQADITHHNH